MEEGQSVDYGYLPHLTEEIVLEARGEKLDAYAIALEGWRRGLDLRWYSGNHPDTSKIPVWNEENPGKFFSLSDGKETHYFFKSRGDLVSEKAMYTAMDKVRTKELLNDAGIPTPAGEYFSFDTDQEEILRSASEIGFPLVVKPVNGSFGLGVNLNIRSTEELISVLNRERYNERKQNILLERFLPGHEYRVYVADGRPVAVMQRQPANVRGDGIHTIHELITLKNNHREKNPRLFSCPIQINNELSEYLAVQGYSIDDIPAIDEKVILNPKSNISSGGDPHALELADTKEINEIAVQSLEVIGDLPHGSVDIIWERASGVSAVLEINPTSQIGSLLFPQKGAAFDIPKAIIDYYFPDSNAPSPFAKQMYFDLSDVIYPLKTSTCTMARVTPLPKGTLHKQRFIVRGDVSDVNFHRGMRKQAFERGLSGYILSQSDGTIEIVVVGDDLEVIEDFKRSIYDDPERSTVAEIKHGEYEGAVKIGFEVKADLKQMIEELEFLEKDIIATEKRYRKVLARNKALRGSLSWRMTYPVRLVGDVVKSIKRKR